jgi:hypothetical protein
MFCKVFTNQLYLIWAILKLKSDKAVPFDNSRRFGMSQIFHTGAATVSRKCGVSYSSVMVK